MKPAVLTLIGGALFLGASVLVQGTVVFDNGPTGLVSRWTDKYDSTPVPLPLGGSDTGDYVELLYAAPGTPAGPLYYQFGFGDSLLQWLARNPGWMLGPSNEFPLVGEPGRFDGGAVSLEGVPAGAQLSYALYGNALGIDEKGGHVNSYYQGISAVFTTATGTDAASAVPLADTFGGMVLVPPLHLAPEPSTISLAALGATAMLLARRRARQNRRPTPG
jgi:hypothetical protein